MGRRASWMGFLDEGRPGTRERPFQACRSGYSGPRMPGRCAFHTGATIRTAGPPHSRSSTQLVLPTAGSRRNTDSPVQCSRPPGGQATKYFA